MYSLYIQLLGQREERKELGSTRREYWSFYLSRREMAYYRILGPRKLRR